VGGRGAEATRAVEKAVCISYTLGGGMWIARLAPAILDATRYRRRAVMLNPDQLAALQAALTRVSNQRNGRWACGWLREALAHHHLRHTIEVDEQRSVAVDDTASAIEG
jgi:hypothetical protein